MSHAAEEAPVMGLGVEQRQLLVQGVMSLASIVQQRRYALDRDAWSDEGNATRSAERTIRVAEPTVRTMSSPEWAAASHHQDGMWRPRPRRLSSIGQSAGRLSWRSWVVSTFTGRS